MKHDGKVFLRTLMLCAGVLFLPVTVKAGGGEDDTMPPEMHAVLSGETLHVEVSDDDTGVDAVYVAGKRVNCRMSDTLDVELADFAAPEDESFTVYAVDYAGNRSKETEFANPLYAGNTGGKTEGGEVPGGRASLAENVTESGREFYTFTTPAGNVFYLVIDRERDSENVYFLNAVTEGDLAALAETEESGTVKKAETEVTEREEACVCTDLCEAGRVNTACPVCRNDLTACTGKEREPEPAPERESAEPEEKAEKKGSGGPYVFVLLAVAAAGAAGYYLKVYRPKHDFDDAEDLDDLLADDGGPEVNEDTEDDGFPEKGGEKNVPGNTANGIGRDMAEREYADYGAGPGSGTGPEFRDGAGHVAEDDTGPGSGTGPEEDTSGWDDYPDYGPGQGE